jgi:hypothetical protein
MLWSLNEGQQPTANIRNYQTLALQSLLLNMELIME